MPNRRCKQCGTKKDINTMRFIGINAFCNNVCYSEFMDKESENPYQIKRTPVKAVSEKKKIRLSEKWTEMELFYKKIDSEIQKKWEIRCGNPYCWKLLDKNQLWPPSFAHILSKGQFPALRYFLNNLVIVCNNIDLKSCHGQIDKLTVWNKKEFEQIILDWKDIDFKNYKK